MAGPDGEAILEALRAVCGEHGFDDSTLSYMASMVEEEEDLNDAQALWALLGDYLEDVDVDEAAGLKLCGELFEKLHPGSASAGANTPAAKAKAKAKSAAGPEGSAGYPAGGALKTPVVLSSLLAPSSTSGGDFGDAYQLGRDPAAFGGIEEMPTERLKVVAKVADAKQKKVARRVERKAWRAEDKTEHAAVWVDLPLGVSIGSGGGVDFHLERYTLPNKRGAGDLLHDATATFAKGRRYGLIGRNGVGKSTLLDAIARREVPGVPACSIFYVRQEVEGDARTAFEWVLQADSERQTLEAEKRKLEANDKDKSAGARLAEVYQKLEDLGAADIHALEKKANDVLSGLGFDDRLRTTPTAELSGGWRMRTAIACALFVSPGMLLLDEPTNHLDLETVLWLERYLSEEFANTLLLVSHDRLFINEVVTDVVLMENEKLEIYRGDFESFEKIREEHRLRQERLHEQQEAKREHLQEYITKHAEAGSNGCKAAAQRKTRMKKLERLGMEAQSAVDGRKLKLSYDGVQEDVAEVEQAQATIINFPDPGVCDSLGNALLKFDDAAFGYGEGPNLFSGVNLSVDQSSRIAFLGKNGAGKSTVIKLLLGKLRPRSGLCAPHRGARISYIAQHHLDELDGEARPMEVALQRFPGDGSASHELRMRMYLATFGLGGEVLPFQLIRTLSGGQKFRISLALAMYSKPHMLVMDEPTNHLDLETIDALIQAVNTFQGGVAIVSHDEHMIGSICKDLYVVANRKVTRFNGTIKEYKKKVLKGIS